MCATGICKKSFAGGSNPRAIRLLTLRDPDKIVCIVWVRLKFLNGFGTKRGFDSSKQMDQRIADPCQHLWRGSFSDSARILTEGYVPNIVQLILDSPMVTHEYQLPFRVRFFLG